eukprot:10783_1
MPFGSNTNTYSCDVAILSPFSRTPFVIFFTFSSSAYFLLLSLYDASSSSSHCAIATLNPTAFAALLATFDPTTFTTLFATLDPSTVATLDPLNIADCVSFFATLANALSSFAASFSSLHSSLLFFNNSLHGALTS